MLIGFSLLVAVAVESFNSGNQGAGRDLLTITVGIASIRTS
jgi:hypothetical protein